MLIGILNKKEPMKEFNEILKKNNLTSDDFCKEIGINPKSFQVMTVSTAKTPKWVKAFVLGSKMK